VIPFDDYLSQRNLKDGVIKKITLNCFAILVVSSVGFSQLKPQLLSEIANEKKACYTNNNIETNLKLKLQPEIISTNEKNLSDATWLIGILLDVSLPGVNLESKLKTGYSGQLYAGYLVSNTFLLSLKIGYIKFGTGENENKYWKNQYEQSYVPLLIGIYYIFETGRAFRPYFGLALGTMMQNYSRKIIQKFNNNTFGDTSTELTFGFVPELGFYYLIASKTMIQVSVSYSIAGSGIGGGTNDAVTYLSSLAGISFALGGN